MKRLFPIVTILFVLLAIPVTIFVVNQNTELRKRAAPATTLALNPASKIVKVGETFALEAQIDTADNQVITAKIHVTFDATKLEALTIAAGTLFPRVQSSGVVENGSASITVGAESNAKPAKGLGTAAVVRFKAIATTQAPITVQFAQDTFANGIGEGSGNVLVSSRPTSITITSEDGTQVSAQSQSQNQASGTSPTATPIPTTTVSLTPTVALTPTPTKAASKSAEATSSAIVILTPAEDASLTDTRPLFKGTASPGATITLVIYSTPQTVVVTADANGNWSYTPTNALEPGPHSIVATAQASGSAEAQSATTSFVVAGQTEDGSTETALPVSGDTTATVLLITVAVLLLISGILVPLVLQ